MTMTEHGFLAAMLYGVVFEVLLLGAVLGYYTYRISRKSAQIEGLTAAAYLEARRALTRSR